MVCHQTLLSLESAVSILHLFILSLQKKQKKKRERKRKKATNETQNKKNQTLTKPKHLQCEDLVPFWVEVLVDGMRQQSVIVQFNYTKWVTFTY